MQIKMLLVINWINNTIETTETHLMLNININDSLVILSNENEIPKFTL